MLTKDIFIHETASVKDALKKLDKTAEKVLLVVDQDNGLLGTVTDGDIRRYILKGKSLEGPLRDVYNRHSVSIKKDDYTIELAREALLKNKIELVPVIDGGKKVIDFATWNQVFSGNTLNDSAAGKIDVPVVIMAGGRGFRMEPFTKILPKPLIPIGDKPIIEVIIDGFRKRGVKEYYVTLNEKGEMIEAYFSHVEKDYDIKYIWEKDGFLGTAGSLKFLKNQISDIFIVSNCDVIVKANFEEVVNFHKDENASLTVLSCIQHHQIPYGVIKFKEKGEVIEIVEKPEYTFAVNTGIYILSKSSLGYIPDKTYFDMTDLIKTLIKDGKRVVTYPVNGKDYIDIGQWEEYKKSVEKLQFFK
ncbi:MAG: sugar phosphate nucleotidyltransferase [Candidatus Omnitrophota bacterium]